MSRGFSPSTTATMPSMISSRLRPPGARAAKLRGKRQQDEVRAADAVHRGDEGDGDAAAELRRLAQVLHDVNQAEHGAENAERRRIAGRRLEHIGRRFGMLAPASLSISRICRHTSGLCRPRTSQARAKERIVSASSSSSSDSMPLRRARLA